MSSSNALNYLYLHDYQDIQFWYDLTESMNVLPKLSFKMITYAYLLLTWF
ncbi:hypothetical protein HanXRQr2_Chr12g0553431 [Helianthus annuus]|uniref:Uncharacterized protein n=1 Tax=Helianthus annuus TaxID=4232 RepID=A0A9K3HIF8_HELAN|nr:hypothetical protein HanXRQr2_Chr12g0553431 [Helianthus annuus]